jgi:hypothetical protein
VAQHPTVLVGEQKRAAAMEQILAAAKARKEENVRNILEELLVDSAVVRQWLGVLDLWQDALCVRRARRGFGKGNVLHVNQ